jgi:ATP-dependent Lon protease
LDQLIGLKEVKDTVRTWINNVKVELEYKKRGMKSMPMTYHLIFDGNPGTGKTTVARIMAKIYRALGVLSKGHLVEVDARSLVAEYVGQTAKRTQDVIDKAQGGVGLVTMLYFSADGKTMQVETYSTDRKAFFLEENQFTLTLDLAGDKIETETTAEVTTAEVTEAPATEPEVTEAPSTEAPATEPTPEKKGCGSSVSHAFVPMILLAIPAFYERKKRIK